MAETDTGVGIDTFEAFLEQAIRRTWVAPESSKATFLSLLLAAPEAWRVAWDESTKDGLTRPVVAVTASVATIVALLRLIASGPLGVLLTGVSIATLVTVYGLEQDPIHRRAETMRGVIARYRVEFDELAVERRARSMRNTKWQLVVDGLLARFLDELNGTLDAPHDPASMGGFSEHVANVSVRPTARRS